MSQINIEGIIKNIKERTNVYTSLMEAIVNSIEAIEDNKNVTGEIKVVLKTDEIAPDLENFDNKAIAGIEIYDNGSGFNQKNRDSFDTLYSNLKVNGKGFGRFICLKYFETIKIKSYYREENKKFCRSFNFGRGAKIIENEVIKEESDSNETSTTIFFQGLKSGKLDNKIETIARKLTEKLLPYFIDENYSCPKIILRDERNNKEVILNDFVKKEGGEIQEISSQEFSLSNNASKEDFKLKVFKIFYPDTKKSRISLVAHKREVTETAIDKYIPEFVENFFETMSNGSKKDFRIKAYVLGDYLDKNVSLERVAFDFGKCEGVNHIYEEVIEKEAARLTKESFPHEINSRIDKKKDRVNDYVNNIAPWHKPYVKDLEFCNIAYDAKEEDFEMALQKIKYHKENITKNKIKKIFEKTDGTKNNPDDILADQVSSLIKEVSDAGKSDLAHYVCNRQVVLKILNKLLERNDDGSAKYEKDIHSIIFPMNKDSLETNYQDHNLWILDEKLVFSRYISSDKKMAKKGSPTKPDLVIFDEKC
ncbi:MAG: hypothetical protein ACJAT4_000048, partial [Granulosicoccus sp.]